MDDITRTRIQAQIDALEKRLSIDSNDLDYESHLHTIRILKRILEKAALSPQNVPARENIK